MTAIKIDMNITRTLDDIWNIARRIEGGHRKRTNFRKRLAAANNALVDSKVERAHKLARVARNEQRFEDMRKLNQIASRWAQKRLSGH